MISLQIAKTSSYAWNVTPVKGKWGTQWQCWWVSRYEEKCGRNGQNIGSVDILETSVNWTGRRKKHTLMDKVKAMSEDTSMPWRFWGGALNHTATIHNCILSSEIGNFTQLQSLSGSPPESSGFRISGCAAYVHMYKEESKAKLADHAQLGVYLGTINGLYKIHLVNTNCIMPSKHVAFDKRTFRIRNFKTYKIPPKS